MKNQSKFQ
jgi:hypothetical protein